LATSQAEPTASSDDLQSVPDVDREHLLEPEGAGLPADERHVVDAEGVLQRGQTVELFQHGIRVEARLDPDLDPQPVIAVGEVGDVADPLELLRLDGVPDLLDQTFGADHVGKLGHDDAGAARAQGLDRDLSADFQCSAARRVGVLYAIEAHQDPARGEVGSRHVLHELLGRRLGVLEQVGGCGDDLDEVVRGHVRRHADGDPGRAVHEEVGEGGGEDRGLLELPVVVGHEVDDVLVEALGESECGGSEACLGVARGGGAVVERTEVPVSVDERDTQGPGLGEAHEGVIDGGVSVWMELSHHLSDHARALDVTAVRPQ
ncbi:hypothetical protein ABE10_00975, partial [Bacillus toyonensis]|nr:hypothetical protein [Bacillus toyonensis]